MDRRSYGYIAIFVIIFGVSLVFVARDFRFFQQSPEVSTITTEDVSYFENVVGFLARPSKQGEYPGVVMIHEWWGLNDHIRRMAMVLAEEGYVVLAVDLFEGEVAQTSQEARQLVSSLDQQRSLSNMQAAVTYLRTHEQAGAIASLGWCFGGGQSLQLALSGEILDATVIYYGSLVTSKSQLAMIKWPILGVFGDQDQVVPLSQVREFKAALNQLQIENEIYIYEGVGHAFANPSGDNYAPEKAEDAWNRSLEFLNKHLKR